MAWDVSLAQERHSLVLDDEGAALEIDAGLVSTEHVQSEQQINLLALHHGKRAGEEHLADANLGRVDAAEDWSGTDSLGDTAVAAVD
jgi:hypothetical protein